ncbi:MAG: proton-conducting transporter membrane subunit [Candidatus Limivivens sp.]|nr:proton-conducting transporter membrane subunit [Candidatus Limivivens sp.]
MDNHLILVFLVVYPFLGGLGAFVLGRRQERLRDYLADFVTASECFLMLLLMFLWGRTGNTGSYAQCRISGICGLGLHFTMDGFRLIYGTIASFMWMMAAVFSREYFTHHGNRNRFYLFLLLTFGATMGVFLAADLFTMFLFFEIMSLTSYVWVAQEEDRPSLRAADTYLAVAVIGGLTMLMGLFLLYDAYGTLEIPSLLEYAGKEPNKGRLYAAGGCLLAGFGAKAGAFPLHIWLPKAHPVAPAPASALLSGILTKTGIFGILVISSSLFLHDPTWGTVLLGLGVVTMFGGALLAVFSIDLKRTLACSSMSQIGFILVGAGMQGLLGEENALAVHGTLLHMMNHSMIKLVLFLAAGVIFMNTHALDLNTIRGFGRKKPLLKAIFLTGALAIGGIPFFGGYISKTLLHESILEYGSAGILRAVEYLFLFSGGLTVAYMTKLYAAVFVEKNESAKVQCRYDRMKHYMNRESSLALGISAGILLVWGLFPHTLMDRAAKLGQDLMQLEDAGETVAYFSLKNLSGAFVSIIIGILVYFLVIRKLLMKKEGKKGIARYVDAWPVWLDLENVVYRPVLLRIFPTLFGFLCRIPDSLLDTLIVVLRKTVYRDSPLPHERPEGTALSETVGKLLNLVQKIRNAFRRGEHPVGKDYVHLMAVKNEEWKENYRIIQRSLSFGLLLFCIGMCLTLVYIIIW